MKSTKKNPLAAKALAHLQKVREEEERVASILAEEERKIKEEELREANILKAKEDEDRLKKEKKQAKIQAQKDAGTYKTPAQKKREKKLFSRTICTSNIIHMDESNVNTNINTNTNTNTNINTNVLRAPIICVMGHVDTGKTTLMDKIRNTNIQQKETAGITQQIDATFIPKSKLPINSIAVPGLLMIDTPGHEAFSNLRIRGSSLADIIIVVIDLVHGLEKQTIEILDILNKTQTKYIIALNKIDRLYGWDNNKLLHDALPECMDEFNKRLSTVKYQLQEQGINSELYWNNTSLQDTVSVCPISARTEQGIIELLTQIAVISETELCDKITISDELKCVVLEKRVLPGYGTIVDALLINGTLTRGDNILIQTNSGTINSKICNLITEHENTTIHGSVAFKLIASGLDNIVVGSNIVGSNISLEPVNKAMIHETETNYDSNGILVYAPTAGSLEALVSHLQSMNVSISATYIGSVLKKHVNKMVISNKNVELKEHRVILAFDVNIDDDAQQLAKSHNITILSDGTIYRLYNQYETLKNNAINERKDTHRHLNVYPCILKILPTQVFRKKGPFLFGVHVQEGNLHINTPLIIPSKNIIVGKVIGIQQNGTDILIANEGDDVCIKVDDGGTNYTYGRQFDGNDLLVSHITRQSIDIMKQHFSDDISNKEGKLNNTGKLLKKIKELLRF